MVWLPLPVLVPRRVSLFTRTWGRSVQSWLPGAESNRAYDHPGVLAVKVREQTPPKVGRGSDPTSCDCSACGPVAHSPCCARRLRSEEHTSELQSREKLVCRLLLEKKNIYSIY